MYKLVYYVNGKEYEIVLQSAPIAVCHWKKKILATTTHKVGELKVEKL